MTNCRFVVDDLSWRMGDVPREDYRHSVDLLTERLGVAHERREAVGLFGHEFYYGEVSAELTITDLLFQENDLLDRDLRSLLSGLLDKTVNLVLAQDAPLEVMMADQPELAAAIAWAHGQVQEGRATAVFPLSCFGRAGPTPVAVAGSLHPIHFVTTEGEHRAFFRDAYEVERASEDTFESLIGSAFPSLLWADDVWRGLRRISHPWDNLRPLLTYHLAGLCDHGARFFRECDGRELEAHFGSLGINASDENGDTKRNDSARKQRSASFRGQEHAFWWHTKLFKTFGRVHFRYFPDLDQVVVGVFGHHFDT